MGGDSKGIGILISILLFCSFVLWGENDGREVLCFHRNIGVGLLLCKVDLHSYIAMHEYMSDALVCSLYISADVCMREREEAFFIILFTSQCLNYIYQEKGRRTSQSLNPILFLHHCHDW